MFHFAKPEKADCYFPMLSYLSIVPFSENTVPRKQVVNSVPDYGVQHQQLYWNQLLSVSQETGFILSGDRSRLASDRDCCFFCSLVVVAGPHLSRITLGIYS